MKISLNTLASVEKTDAVTFMNMTGLSYQSIEKFISGQFNKFNLLRAKVYRAQDMGKMKKAEFEEIVSFCNEMLQKCEAIAQNFDLFKNLGVPKPSFSEYNRRVKSLLTK